MREQAPTGSAERQRRKNEKWFNEHEELLSLDIVTVDGKNIGVSTKGRQVNG